MKTLYRKLVIPIMICFILALSASLFLSIYQIDVVIRSDIENLTNELLQSKANEIDNFLSSRTVEMEALANVLALQEPTDIEQTLVTISAYLDKLNDYESLGIIDQDGYKHVTTGAVFDVSSREYYQQITSISASTYIGNPVVSLDNEESIFIIVTKIVKEGQVVGYLSGAVTIDYLNQVISESNRFSFPTTIINADTEEILLGSPLEKIAYQSLKLPISSNPNWIIQIQVPDSFMSRHLLSIIISLILFTALLSVVLLLFLKSLLSKTIQPITVLHQHMTAPSLEEIDEPNDNNTLELHELTDSYNTMVVNTNQLIETIQEKERSKKESEMKALMQQIKPHFLYNTLEMIQTLSLDYEDDRIESLVSKLSSYFRLSLSNDQTFISLKDELLHVQNYLDIQLLRYTEKFDYQIENKTSHNYYLMKFCLQPIVENAIYHGIKKDNKKGMIQIKIQEVDNQLKISISNTYQQINQETITKLNNLFQTSSSSSDYPGYGLFNVNERLLMYFGDISRLNITYDSTYVTVTFYHPLIETEEEYARYLNR